MLGCCPNVGRRKNRLWRLIDVGGFVLKKPLEGVAWREFVTLLEDLTFFIKT